MLFVGKEYIVKFPMGGNKIMTLHEVHNPQQAHEPLYTFIDCSKMKVTFSKSVCSRIKFQFHIDLPPVPRILQRHHYHPIYYPNNYDANLYK